MTSSDVPLSRLATFWTCCRELAPKGGTMRIPSQTDAAGFSVAAWQRTLSAMSARIYVEIRLTRAALQSLTETLNALQRAGMSGRIAQVGNCLHSDTTVAELRALRSVPGVIAVTPKYTKTSVR